MSKYGTLRLHANEEAVAIALESVLQPVPIYRPASPITEYFRVTDGLKVKILAPGVQDSELFGLLAVGVISAVEFYLRNIMGKVPEVCPIARRYSEMATVPSGAAQFYSGSPFPHLLASFDHESLADGKKIFSAVAKFAGIKLGDDTSVEKVIADFDRLCELRHCLVHSCGYVGLKACNALDLPFRQPHKILMGRGDVLEILKIAHNVVRAVNRYLADQIADRWVDKGVLFGEWKRDRELFSTLFNTFRLEGEDAYSGNSYRAYIPFGKAARARAEAMLARVTDG